MDCCFLLRRKSINYLLEIVLIFSCPQQDYPKSQNTIWIHKIKCFSFAPAFFNLIMAVYYG